MGLLRRETLERKSLSQKTADKLFRVFGKKILVTPAVDHKEDQGATDFQDQNNFFDSDSADDYMDKFDEELFCRSA